MTYAHCYADSARGVYIPQHFAETVNRDMLAGVDSDDLDILAAGPGHGDYWETWESVLDNAELTDSDGVTWRLYQDGDLWLIAFDAARDALNEAIAWQVEYEESHQDAGDAYGHMPRESWTGDDTRRLVESLGETDDIDPRWRDIDPDRLADIALESFDMKPGSIWGPYDGGVVIGGYPVSEIEIQLDSLGVDGIALECVKDSLDAHVSGDFAYVSTDAAWYAVLNVEMFNAAIAGELA